MNREDKTFPEQLRIWRKSRRLNQTQAGKVLGVFSKYDWPLGGWQGTI